MVILGLADRPDEMATHSSFCPEDDAFRTTMCCDLIALWSEICSFGDKLNNRKYWFVVSSYPVGGHLKDLGIRREVRPVWQGVSTDCLKFHLGLHARPFYALRAGHPRNGLMAISGVASPQIGRPVAVFYPLGYPTLHGPEGSYSTSFVLKWTKWDLLGLVLVNLRATNQFYLWRRWSQDVDFVILFLLNHEFFYIFKFLCFLLSPWVVTVFDQNNCPIEHIVLFYMINISFEIHFFECSISYFFLFFYLFCTICLCNSALFSIFWNWLQ